MTTPAATCPTCGGAGVDPRLGYDCGTCGFAGHVEACPCHDNTPWWLCPAGWGRPKSPKSRDSGGKEN